MADHNNWLDRRRESDLLPTVAGRFRLPEGLHAADKSIPLSTRILPGTSIGQEVTHSANHLKKLMSRTMRLLFLGRPPDNALVIGLRPAMRRAAATNLTQCYLERFARRRRQSRDVHGRSHPRLVGRLSLCPRHSGSAVNATAPSRPQLPCRVRHGVGRIDWRDRELSAKRPKNS